jgi:hypothetical protein
MSGRTGDADEKRAAAREAHREGKSASEAGSSSGASKQLDHARTSDREPKGDAKS